MFIISIQDNLNKVTLPPPKKKEEKEKSYVLVVCGILIVTLNKDEVLGCPMTSMAKFFPLA